VDAESFWQRHAFTTPEDAEAALAEWEHHYNYERFSLALGGLTPAEKLHLKLNTAGPNALLGPVIHQPPSTAAKSRLADRPPRSGA
jgi:hypothetical protein